MIKANVNCDLTIDIFISKNDFLNLLDDSYFEIGDYPLNKFKDLEIDKGNFDIDCFVSDQIMSMVDENGLENKDFNNEWFENFEAYNCFIKEIKNDILHIKCSFKEII